MLSLRRALLLLALTALAAAACDLPAAPVPVEPQTTSLVERRFHFGPAGALAVILVVDDAATADAAALRSAIAGSLRAGLDYMRMERFANCGNPDPAAWHTGDVRLVVARPSAPDGEALLTPVERPGLAWITRTSSEEEIDALTTAAVAALGERTAQPGEAYRPLRAAQRALDLVAGTRAPASPAEAAFAASLPAYRGALLVVASTRDDEDPTPVDQLALGEAARDEAARIDVVGPFGPQDAICQVFEGDQSRLAAWAKASSAGLYTWPCASPTWDDLFNLSYADCGSDCVTQKLAVHEGVADCTVTVDQMDLGGCDPERGWRDPEGHVTLVTREGTELRRCEVVQLAGAALESCREDLACSGCPSGWCATEVPELIGEWTCHPGTYAWPLRFVGGALDAPGGWVEIRCTAAAE